jgi:glycosyltransferase involved in cell wall biosynthesis
VRVGFIVQGLPGEGYHGGALTCWAIVRALIRAGHEVSVISLFDTTDANPYVKYRERQEAALRREGAEVLVLEYEMASLTASRDRSCIAKLKRWAGRICNTSKGTEYLMPWHQLSGRVRNVLDGRTFDAFLCYHFDALAAASPLRLFPLMAAVGDLWHMPGYFRWRDLSPSLAKYGAAGVKVLLETVMARRAMVSLLSQTQACGAFAGHYADWLKAHGVPHAVYLRTPVPDVTGMKWENLRKQKRGERASRKHRVLVMGDLGTTSTSFGLRSIMHAILPRLVADFGEGFELRLVGGGTPPPDIAAALQRPYVHFAGRVLPADPEFLSADVMLVPTNIPLGIRVRIITAWSFGCPVVAHRANASGIPEMKHGENCLLADTDTDLAEAVSTSLGDEGLNARLSYGGRATFEKCFSEAVAGQAIVDELVRVRKQASK